MVVGRLATDEEFRRRFMSDPEHVLADLREWGTHLTHVEIAALIATNLTLWETVAGEIDPRLQKARLENE
jgi:hypothetical protein